jgi:2-polyprenyl-6-methoxyphenol hydroxylase-like FAD-dependent oxidoreductase
VRTAVVVGAGVGGLAAAGALARGGWHTTLIERGDRLRGSGGAQVIWPNGLAALHSLGLSLGDVSFPMPTGGIRRPDGRWLIQAEAHPEAAGDPLVVHADDLHDALMAGLGDRIEIRTATEITSVRAGEADRPAVGTGRHTLEADLVVAADGAHSVIRRRLAPQSTVTSAGYTAWRAVIPWFRAPQLPEPVGAAGEILGTGHRFVYAALGERGTSAGNTRGGIYWVATVPGAMRPESAAAQLGLLRRWFAQWQAPVGELLEATEPTDLVQQPGEELDPLPRQFGIPVGGGGVALLGDAAHVASPTLTQGACLAFEDAATLGILMRSATPGANLNLRLDEYTLSRRVRVGRVARTSRRLGRLYQAQGRLTVRARDVALTRLSPRLLDRAGTAAHHWAPPA